ncbi:hypothetical protein MaudCBS49596_003142 [Microsporum audouinii]
MEDNPVVYENSTYNSTNTHSTRTPEHWNSDETVTVKDIYPFFTGEYDIAPRGKQVLAYDYPLHKENTQITCSTCSSVYSTSTVASFLSPKNSATSETPSSCQSFEEDKGFEASDIHECDEFGSVIDGNLWLEFDHYVANTHRFPSTNSDMVLKVGNTHMNSRANSTIHTTKQLNCGISNRIPGTDGQHSIPGVDFFPGSESPRNLKTSTKKQTIEKARLPPKPATGNKNINATEISAVNDIAYISDMEVPRVEPFVRSNFPLHTSSPSAVQGLSSDQILLRTCFRIGETLASRNIPDMRAGDNLRTTTVVELYASVSKSYRSGPSQIFIFSDIFFPAHPPYLMGEWRGWQQNSYLNQVGRYFLSEDGSNGYGAKLNNKQKLLDRGQGRSKMCRVVGVISQEGSSFTEDNGHPRSPISQLPTGHGRLRILRIQKADWSDIALMKKAMDI